MLEPKPESTVSPEPFCVGLLALAAATLLLVEEEEEAEPVVEPEEELLLPEEAEELEDEEPEDDVEPEELVPVELEPAERDPTELEVDVVLHPVRARATNPAARVILPTLDMELISIVLVMIRPEF
ncbi:hypothetical protein [uncultured Cohaesibacter sp.]|uniref:hypothetical protein n=1 Tax=uncultured Cohaesibacter sp. TaxID=1002546 RepID=UPI0029C6B156|nr:hypothetical protein [uncultured Cohaesibacter sp.]